MGVYLRQLWKQKPQAWGPFSAVQAGLFHNAEKMGIDSPIFAPFLWEKSGDPHDYAQGATYTLKDNSPVITWGPEGQRFGWDSGYMYDNGVSRMSTNEGTIVYVGNLLGNYTYDETNYGIGFRSYGGDIGPSIGVYMSSNTYHLFYTNPDTTFSGTDSNSDIGVKNSLDFQLATSWQNGSQRLFLNGVFLSEKMFTGSYSATTSIGLGAMPSLGACINGFNGELKSAFIFPKQISDDKISELYDNPYQLLQPYSPPVYFDLAGGGLLPINFNAKKITNYTHLRR